MDNAFIYDTVIGKIMIADNGEAITRLYFENQIDEKNFNMQETPLIKQAISQINEYLCGKRKNFDIKLAFSGTDFQKRVWNALTKIPYGKTASYKDIAKEAGNEKACRAVGMANHNNPIAIIIPCHRVIGANGSLVGFGGGLGTKEFLLNLEQKNI